MQDSDQCKPDDEIDEALQGAHLVVYSKQVLFDFTKYGEQSIKTDHKAEQFLLSRSLPQFYPMELIRMMVSLQDLLLNLDSLTLFERSNLWTVRTDPAQSIDSLVTDGLLGLVEISLSQDLIHYERKGYTLLDLLSDIGGMIGLFYSFISFTVNIFSSGIINEYLVTKLYNVHQHQSHESKIS